MKIKCPSCGKEMIDYSSMVESNVICINKKCKFCGIKRAKGVWE